MPSHGLAHCSDPKSCHHCHITSPIPVAQLIKTHPLRTKLPSPRLLADSSQRHVFKNEEEGSSGFSSDVAPFTKIHQSPTFKSKARDALFGDEILRKALLQRENEIEFLKSTQSYRHKVSPKSALRGRPPAESPHRTLQKRSPINSSPRLRDYHYHGTNQKHSPELSSSKLMEYFSHADQRHSPIVASCRLKDHCSHGRHRKHSPVISSNRLRDHYSHGFDLNHSPVISSLRLREQLERYPQLSPDIILSASKPKFNPLYSDVRNHSKSHRKEFGTQTSKISGSYGDLFSDYSSLNIYKNAKRKQKKSKFNLPTGLLCAGYALLIVIAVAIAVVLSQRTGFFQNDPQRPRSFAGVGPRPINIPGAVRISNPQAGGGRRRVQVSGQRRPSQIFSQTDFDYLDTGALDGFIAKPQKPSRGSSIFPQFSSIAQQPAPVATPSPIPRALAPAPTRVAAPRRSNQNRQGSGFRQRFDIAGLEEELVEEVAPKEPEVKILESWSNTNSDGSFSYGYINSDGSFKNESRGSDCVSRGIWGYVDEATGQTISHPYETGIPCDPNAPDYFYDYETGSIANEETFVDDRRNRLSQVDNSRRLAQG